MRYLFHLPIDPQCRKIRILLAEKKLEFDLEVEPVWERREGFLQLNPACEVPVLTETDGTAISGGPVIAEYLEDAYDETSFLGKTPTERAETRRMVLWFEGKFHREVTANLVEQKVTKRLYKSGQPDSGAIRAGHSNIHYHLEYIAWLCDRRRWLSGDSFSLADIAAAAQLSCLDFIGDVPWEKHPDAKDWYARVKSRPSMRPILADHVVGTKPPEHYADPDF
ncbi:glutathione S-transferase family protein [Denitrobaculum tricleocarpae]|uniref:Glutathione S-transferase family protein n=1 Tax=Denitrobaculum tricleocarpae TaxID=2591009 RepID=A0A545U1D0_9PROT|nr:glutathione S-transferase family protein [Denitrobaculum tricleocarpae]TQV83213.1 glutathione S-transferase family protein [Denitrobaculum tricleocarpae]